MTYNMEIVYKDNVEPDYIEEYFNTLEELLNTVIEWNTEEIKFRKKIESSYLYYKELNLKLTGKNYTIEEDTEDADEDITYIIVNLDHEYSYYWD